MIDLERQLEERLHEIAEEATIRPDLAGVKSGLSRNDVDSPSDNHRSLPSRKAFVAAVAAVVLGGLVVGNALQRPGPDIASDATADESLADPSTDPSLDEDGESETGDVPSDELGTTALADVLPTFYLQGEGISPQRLGFDLWPGTDASDPAWSLMSSYGLRATDFPDDQREGYGVNVYAVPTTVEGVADLDDRLADLRNNGTAVEQVSVGGRDGWRFYGSEGELISVLFETEDYLVTMLFWPNTDDDTMARTFAAVGDDLAGFQQVATDDRLVSDGSFEPWVLSRVEDPDPELLALFPAPDTMDPDDGGSEDAGSDDLIPDGFLTESNLADGTYTYTFRELADHEPEQPDPDFTTGCEVFDDLLAQIGPLPHRIAKFSGTDGWDLSQGLLDLDAQTDAQILLDRFRRVGQECEGWDDLSTDEVSAFGQGNFILAAYMDGDRLFYFELKNGTGESGPARLTELLAAVGKDDAGS